MSDVTINLDVSTSDKVTFHNKHASKSVSLDLPEKSGVGSPFSGNPASPVTIAAGGNSPQYNISASSGTYDYSWNKESDASLATRTGRIIVT